MNESKFTSGRFSRSEDTQQPAEGRKNPIAAFLAKTSIVARKELPVVFDGVMAMAIISILTGIQWISIEFMLILALSTLMLTAFRAGMVWQYLCSKEVKKGE